MLPSTRSSTKNSSVKNSVNENWKPPKNWRRPNGQERKSKPTPPIACGRVIVSSQLSARSRSSWHCWRAMFGVRSNQNEVRAEANFKQAEAQRLALEANRLLTAGGSSEQIALLSLQSMKTQYTTEGDAALAAAARLEYPVKLFKAVQIRFERHGIFAGWNVYPHRRR